MRVPIAEIDPVAIALEEIEITADIRFSGIDLESGARVTVSIIRESTDRVISSDAVKPTTGLVLVRTMETLQGRR